MTEARIRSDIRSRLSRIFGSDSGALLVEEMEVCSGRARIDMAVISNRLIGIEIKGPEDGLKRLRNQADQYSRCFDQIVLVVDDGLAEQAIKLIPKWWGVIIGSTQSDSYAYRLIRRPARNLQVEVDTLLALLWREEVMSLWERFVEKQPPSKASKKRLRNELLANVQPQALKCATIESLKKRIDWRSMPISHCETGL